jgi:hypothetical protein
LRGEPCGVQLRGEVGLALKVLRVARANLFVAVMLVERLALQAVARQREVAVEAEQRRALRHARRAIHIDIRHEAAQPLNLDFRRRHDFRAHVLLQFDVVDEREHDRDAHERGSRVRDPAP